MVEEMVILLLKLSDIDIIVLWFRIDSLLYHEVLKILVLEIIVHRENCLHGSLILPWAISFYFPWTIFTLDFLNLLSV